MATGKLEGKVAIVTGGGTGIGLGVSKALVKEGAIVVITGRRAEVVEAAAEELRTLGGKVLAISGDVGSRADCKAVVEQTVKEFGTVDILVNNAVSMTTGKLEEATDEVIDMTVRSGLYGTLYLMQYCFPYMKERGGKIINMGSAAGENGDVMRGVYGAVKSSIGGLTRCAGLEWGRYRINVNMVCPIASTPLWEENARQQPANAKKILDSIPYGRMMGDPEKHVGRVVVFLASEDSEYITTRTFFVDGGFGSHR